MKKFLFAASAAAMLTATPAFAQSSATDSFVINADVAPTCLMENVDDIEIGFLKIVTTAGENALEFKNGSSAASADPVYLSCNDTNNMTMVVPALKGDRAPTAEEAADGFTDTVHLRLWAQNYGASTLETFSKGPVLNAGPRPAMHRLVTFTGEVDADDNANVRPLAGDYSSTVEVTVAIAP